MSDAFVQPTELARSVVGCISRTPLGGRRRGGAPASAVPARVSPIVTPHLHVSAALRPSSTDGAGGLFPLDKRHLVTGVVPRAAFVRMLIVECGVEPLAGDWQARLVNA